MQSTFRVNPDPQSSMATPDSPGEPPQTPPPPGAQGDVELELIGLANALYNLGTTVVNDLSKERQQAPNGDSAPIKPVGQRVNDVIGHLATIEELGASIPTMIPFQTLQDIDNAKNPMLMTKDRIERAATENQFMNGKIQAIDSYCKLLNAALSEYFPETAPYLDTDVPLFPIACRSDGPSEADVKQEH